MTADAQTLMAQPVTALDWAPVPGGDVLKEAARWNAEGVAARAEGRPSEAVECYRRALTLAPGSAAIWSNLGNALVDLKEFPQALVSLRRALALEPLAPRLRRNLVLALNAAGVAARGSGRPAEAIACYEEALGLDETSPALWSNLGNALMDLTRQAMALDAEGVPNLKHFLATPEAMARLERAITCHRRALAAKPDHGPFRDNLAGALNAWGIVLRDAGDARALACCQEVAALAPMRRSSWSNLGNVLKDLKYLDTAIACHRRAVALEPGHVGGLFNLAVALAAATRSDEAIGVLNQALALKPGDPHLRWDRALNHLRRGDYAAGWADYDARLETGALPPRHPPGKVWTGERYDGQSLVVVSEQGFGDTLWAARYLPAVKARGGTLIVECRRDMVPLIAALGIADRVVAKADPLPAADLHVNICSIPGLFVREATAISGAPYIRPPGPPGPALAEALARGRDRLKIGIVWSGSTTFKANQDRAVPLARFVEAFALPGVQLYSLQKGPPSAELAALPGAPVIDLAPLLHDFAEAAIAVDALDLVIMTDSAVAHLAGAIGKPVWVLLNYGAYWLWLTERADSPWYASMRLFRAKAWHDWTGVFDRAAAALVELTHNRGGTVEGKPE